MCSPFVGAAMGLVTYIVVAAGLVASGAAADKTRGSLAVLVAAFIAAYNGDQFRALIQKAGDGLFETPTSKTADPTQLPRADPGGTVTPTLSDTSQSSSQDVGDPPTSDH